MNVPDPFSSDQPRAGTDLRAFYVSRLERLIRLRNNFEEQLNSLGVELLDRSIYATLRDCIDNGAGRRARTLMSAMARGPRSSKTR